MNLQIPTLINPYIITITDHHHIIRLTNPHIRTSSHQQIILDIFQSSALMPIVWFLAISGGLIFGTIYFYFRLRTSNFARTRHMLEQRVLMRTKQLMEKNKELEELS